MAALCDMTVDYLKTRKQFGQAIGKFQIFQHCAVDMRCNLELATCMAMPATVAIGDEGERRRSRDISAARAAIGKASCIFCQSAIQLHGAIALSNEYPAGAYVNG